MQERIGTERAVEGKTRTTRCFTYTRMSEKARERDILAPERQKEEERPDRQATEGQIGNFTNVEGKYNSMKAGS